MNQRIHVKTTCTARHGRLSAVAQGPRPYSMGHGNAKQGENTQKKTKKTNVMRAAANMAKLRARASHAFLDARHTCGILFRCPPR